jgi:hypothetical protein
MDGTQRSMKMLYIFAIISTKFDNVVTTCEFSSYYKIILRFCLQGSNIYTQNFTQKWGFLYIHVQPAWKGNNSYEKCIILGSQKWVNGLLNIIIEYFILV